MAGGSVAWDMLALIRGGAVDCDPMLTHMEMCCCSCC